MTATTRADGGWPAWLPVGALRVVRSSSRYEETVRFYHDRLGLTVLENFSTSHGEDGTILGLPAAATHLEIVRSAKPASAADEFDQLVFYLPSRSAVEAAVAALQRARAGARGAPALLLGGQRRRHVS